METVAGRENALRAGPKDEEGFKDQEIRQPKRKVGELVLRLDIIKEAMKGHPTEPRTSEE